MNSHSPLISLCRAGRRPPSGSLWRQLALAGLLTLASACSFAQTAASAPAGAASTPSLSAEVGKLLQAAQDALKAGNFKDALSRVAAAEAMPALSPYERYIILRLKAPASFGAGDLNTAVVLFESIIESPLLPATERLLIAETTVKLLLQQKEYARAASRMKAYLADGGSSAEMRRLYPQVLSVLGDHAGVLRELAPQLAADDAAKRASPEAVLRLLAASQSALKDMPAYIGTLERLAGTTGKPEYWAELISRLARRDGFAQERLQLDVYRLRRATGAALAADELGDMAYRAQQAGLPADRKLLEAATKAAAQDRAGLADGEAEALKAKDGNAAIGLGLALSATGAHDRALPLMSQGMAKGGLRRADDARLHLGVAQWRAGKLEEAKRSFAAVQGTDGAADLARLWQLHLGRLPAP